MSVYAIEIIPIMEAIKSDDRVKHVAFVHDLSEAGTLASLLRWWDNLAEVGPKLGYYPKASKSWPVVQPEVVDDVQQVFADLEDHYRWTEMSRGFHRR